MKNYFKIISPNPSQLSNGVIQIKIFKIISNTPNLLVIYS